ncbi:SAM hydrolase/SAM-dependent halogenase family protein [Candidatus Accumulibacter aalborgensis]|uniref:SAM hydrolase/SAM-dependent halogenase family protein n=1 Tax=Candidatus Accumulibacter aalborgensis TaxID=1860102 RepID=UPI001648CAD5|nr:SAM-dependent chlorinase/fluorinase [Candidatus Accumulibacter aalborgensis]
MIVLYTDFGIDDPYVGQMKAALLRHGRRGRDVPIIDLLHAVPNFDPRAGAHLLAALATSFDRSTVFLAVVDPGVGSDLAAVVLEADGKFYVGPDNGLLGVVAARAQVLRTWRITWQPDGLSASFHGRDLFAPIAARIAAGKWPAGAIEECDGLEHTLSADDLSEVIYLDHYGNAMTGMRASNISREVALVVGARRIPPARVFSEVPPGQTFWYENSVGLVEIAVNRGSAASVLLLAVGSPVALDA